MMVDDVLAKLGIELPPPPKPVANYVGVCVVGDLLFTSGVLPIQSGGSIATGKVGDTLSTAQGAAAAALALLNALSLIREELSGFDRVRQVVRMTGFVASADGFVEQPAVVNGASDLLVKLFEDRGRHTRLAVGVAELPLGAAVELELILHIA